MARGLKFRIECTIRIAKTKALISFAVTAKLICVFVFAYEKIRFSHDAAQITSAKLKNPFQFKLYNVENPKARSADETVHYELSHLDLQCLQMQFLLCMALYGLNG